MLDPSKEELGHIRLVVDRVQITSITDGGSGYIDALAAPHDAEVGHDLQRAESCPGL